MDFCLIGLTHNNMQRIVSFCSSSEPSMSYSSSITNQEIPSLKSKSPTQAHVSISLQASRVYMKLKEILRQKLISDRLGISRPLHPANRYLATKCCFLRTPKNIQNVTDRICYMEAAKIRPRWEGRISPSYSGSNKVQLKSSGTHTRINGSNCIG